MGNEKSELENRVASLEAQFAAISAKVESMGSTVGKRKQTETEKQERKLKLLEAGPYNKESIAKLNNREVKMLASAMNINTFAKSRTEAVQLILGKVRVAPEKSEIKKEAKK